MSGWHSKLVLAFGATNLWFNPPASLSPDRNRQRPIPIQTKSCPWRDLHLHDRRFELRASPLGYTGDAIGAHGRICTDTSRVLRAPSLRWTTWANWYRVKDLHPQPPRSERGASAVGLTRRESEDPGTPELARPATVRSFRRSGVKCSSSPDACRRGRTGGKRPANC